MMQQTNNRSSLSYLLIIGILCLLFFPSSLKAQEATIKKLHQKTLTENDSVLINAYLDLAWLFIKKQTDSAIFYGNKALDKSKKIKSWYGEMQAESAIGVAYSIAGNYSMSIGHNLKTYDIAIKHNRTVSLPSILNNIGNDYAQIKDYTHAIEYLEKTIEQAEKQNKPSLEQSALGTIAGIYNTLKKFTKAEEYINKAIAISKQYKDTLHLAFNYVTKSEILTKNKKYIQSNLFLLKSLKMRKQDDDYGRTTCLLRLAENHIHLKKFDQAQTYLDQANLLIEKGNFAREKYQLNLLYSQVNENKGNIAKAFEQYKLSQTQKDSIFSKDKEQYISNLQVQFDTKAKAQELEQTKKEMKLEQTKRRTFLIIAFILLFVIAFAISNVRKRNKILARENENAKEKILIEQEKLKQLKEKNLLNQQKEEYNKQLMQLEQEKLVQQLQKAELDRQCLAFELDEKHRKLLTNTMQQEQQKEFLTELIDALSDLKNNNEKNKIEHNINQLISIIKGKINQSDDWERIKLYFEKVHPEFFDKLKNDYPALSVNELKFCAYTKMNLNGKEISRLLNINPTSVQVSRHRLKKKMELPEDVSFTDYILQNY